jgi:predicted acylesterase/phospholipase RssA
VLHPSTRRSARLLAPSELAGSDGVLRSIALRRVALAEGRGRDDGRRIGLVVEGGAMRGVVSGGALVGLEDLGLTPVFDVAYGASAGAINLAYFATGQAAHASEIYLQHLITREFANPLRIRKILDLEFAFDRVIRAKFPLDVEGLRSATCEVKVSVTDATSGRNRLVSLHDRSIDPYEALKASSAVPFYYGRRVALQGGQFVDGMASDALPVRAALADGCTDVLVLLSTRPGEGSARAPRFGGRDIAWPERVMLRGAPLGFRRAYLTRRRRLRVQLTVAHHDERVHALYPTRACPVPSRICRDPDELRRAFEAARLRARELFGGASGG